jgi:hypothetical protein
VEAMKGRRRNGIRSRRRVNVEGEEQRSQEKWKKNKRNKRCKAGGIIIRNGRSRN